MSTDDFNLIFSRISAALDATTASEVAETLGISRQAIYNAKRKGEVPRSWLKILRDEHNLSPDWIQTGQGERRIGGGADGSTRISIPPCRRPGAIQRAGSIQDPQSELVQSAAGKLVGDLLHDAVLGRLNMDFDEFAQACGLENSQMDAILESRELPWKAMRAMAMLGVNLNFLLVDQWPDCFPTGLLGRAMWALGAEDTSSFGRLIDARTRDVEKVRNGEMDFPYEWERVCIERFGLSPNWLSEGHLPTHRSPEIEKKAPEIIPEISQSNSPSTELGKELQEIRSTLQAVGASEDEIKQALLDYVSGGRMVRDRSTGTDDGSI